MTRSEPQYRDVQYSRMLAVLGLFIGFGTGVAIGAVYGGTVRLLVWILAALALGWLLQRTRLEVGIDALGVDAGRAHIGWAHVARVEVLDADGLRQALGPAGHPNDYRQVRGGRGGVRVWLDDATDPHPSWVLSVRDPEGAAAAIRRSQEEGVSHGG